MKQVFLTDDRQTKPLQQSCPASGRSKRQIFGSNSLISARINIDEIEKKLKSIGDPSCVYITSPDYFGNIQDVKKISVVCKKYGAVLLVDNAHGACLSFMDSTRHPIHLGADMCADSAHKTLPVLTGGAYLHVGNKLYINKIKSARLRCLTACF